MIESVCPEVYVVTNRKFETCFLEPGERLLIECTEDDTEEPTFEGIVCTGYRVFVVVERVVSGEEYIPIYGEGHPEPPPTAQEMFEAVKAFVDPQNVPFPGLVGEKIELRTDVSDAVPVDDPSPSPPVEALHAREPRVEKPSRTRRVWDRIVG